MRMRVEHAVALAVLACACGGDEGGRGEGGGPGLSSATLGGDEGDSGDDGIADLDGDDDGDDDDDATTATSAGDTAGGDGIKFDLPSATGDDGGPPIEDCNPELMATVRDFPASHPDFEYEIAVDPGIVSAMLGADGLPVYAGGTAGTTTGQANFDQWYRDTPGANMPLPTAITLVDQGGGSYVYDNPAFFPIDGQGFGNEGNPHNYHFTLEMHTQFTYEGGEVFTFRGDDDLFTFVNGRLAIDLGGVHGPLEGSIDFDAMAAQLGITPGNTYAIDFFFAERHTSESNFRIETTIGCFHPPA
jgi:fibro-slime domain-containing protein